MGIDWQSMEFWPPKKRRPGEEFLFYQPATSVGNRIALRARTVVDNAAPYPRETTWWARINPPEVP